MRRALVLAGVLLAGILVARPTLAAGSGREVERELAFALRAEGFTVQVIVSNNDGDVSATTIVNRGPQVAYYSAPAKVTATRVTARFGRLGELDYRFAPTRGGSITCNGAEEGAATFEGTFEFTGENGYVHIDASHAEGSFQIYPEPKSCSRGRLGRRVVPYHPSYSDEGATLRARAGSRGSGRIREVAVSDPGQRGPHRVFVYATLAERREGMTVSRGLQLTARSGAFRLGPRRGHGDTASAGPVHRLGDLHPARPRWPWDLEGLVGHADPRRRTGEADRRRVPRLPPQRGGAGRVSLRRLPGAWRAPRPSSAATSPSRPE